MIHSDYYEQIMQHKLLISASRQGGILIISTYLYIELYINEHCIYYIYLLTLFNGVEVTAYNTQITNVNEDIF